MRPRSFLPCTPVRGGVFSVGLLSTQIAKRQLVILLLLSEESLVGTFLGALCSYERSAPTHFG